jgi:hypothetical protein
MFCDSCGIALQNESKFCPRCGRRSILDASVSDQTPKIESPVIENIAAEPEQLLEADGPTSDDPSSNISVQLISRMRHANGGSITLGVFCLICFIIGAVQGFIPIFLIAGLAFGGLAWLCAVKWPLSEVLLSVILASSLLVAGLVGVILDQDSFGPRYRYLTQGNQQLRIDEKAGRTDRLAVGSWVPVAFDKPPQNISTLGGNIIDDILAVQLTGGTWSTAGLYGGQEVCFTIKNSSNYVLQSVSITVTTQQKDDPKNMPTSSEQVILKSKYGGLIQKGESDLICGRVSHVFASGESWSYSNQEVLGWK